MLKFYLDTLTRAVTAPRRLFGQLPRGGTDIRRSLGFLLISSLFFALASAAAVPAERPALRAALYLTNAVGMTLISAGLGHVLIVAVSGGKVIRFRQTFGIYAIASGTTLLAAWIPWFLIFTEPWKWWLIGTGMIRACRLSAFQALLVIALSIAVMVGAFRCILPFTLPQPAP